MAQSSTKRNQKFRNKLRRRVKGMFNFRCCSCHTTQNLEFAHRIMSNLGMGRGFQARTVLVYKYPWSFMLMCHKCHTVYDLINNSPKRVSESKEEFRQKVMRNIEKIRKEYPKDIKGDIEKIRKEYPKDIKGDIKEYYERML